MKRHSLAWLVMLAAATVWGQAAPINTFYTHTGAEKLYRQGQDTQPAGQGQDARPDIYAGGGGDAGIAGIEKAGGAKAYQIAEPLIDLATVYMRLAKYGEAKQVMDRAE